MTDTAPLPNTTPAAADAAHQAGTARGLKMAARGLGFHYGDFRPSQRRPGYRRAPVTA